MFQVIYEHQQPWPKEGVLNLEPPKLIGKIQVSPDSARRRVNGYLAMYIAMEFHGGNPALIWGEQPVWRVPVYLGIPELQEPIQLGTVDVDATSREIIPLTTEQIHKMRVQAHDIVTRFTPTPTEPI